VDDSFASGGRATLAPARREVRREAHQERLGLSTLPRDRLTPPATIRYHPAARRSPPLTRLFRRADIVPMPALVPRYTATEVRRFPDDRVRYEVIRGELFVTPAPGTVHHPALLQPPRRLHYYHTTDRRDAAPPPPDVEDPHEN